MSNTLFNPGWQPMAYIHLQATREHTWEVRPLSSFCLARCCLPEHCLQPRAQDAYPGTFLRDTWAPLKKILFHLMPHVNTTACTVSVSLELMPKLLPKLPGGRQWAWVVKRRDYGNNCNLTFSCYVTRSISFLPTAERTLMFCYNTEQQLRAAKCHK